MLKKSKDHFIPFKEFVALMALLMPVTALSIDAVMPALSIMGHDLGVVGENQTQLVISFLFLGFTFGQLIYGPISDSFGRKRAIYIGLSLFCVGSVLSLIASSYTVMLAGRLLQGFGAASSRVITVAMIRDQYVGRDMARVMSFVMGIFIFVPALAPSIGQVILYIAHWRAIFILFLVVAITGMTWMFLRLPETLHAEKRAPFRLHYIWAGVRTAVTNKTTCGYALCAGIMFGSFIGYLTSAQQIFQDYFKVGDMFAVYFAVLALAVGSSSFANSAVVKRYGMRHISRISLISMVGVSAVFLALCLMTDNNVPFWAFMIYGFSIFLGFGFLFGNLNAIAMEPMGHIAGVASAFIGAFSSAISVAVGTMIGQAFNMTLVPITLGFLFCAILSALLQLWLDKDHIEPIEQT